MKISIRIGSVLGRLARERTRRAPSADPATEDGRYWLRASFAEHGAQVATVAVYSRRLHRMSAAERQQLRTWITADERPAIIFSTPRHRTLDQQLMLPGQAWLRTEPPSRASRIAEQLSSNGYARVLNATFDEDRSSPS